MGIYFDIVKFNFLRFFAYPWEIVASVLKRIVELLFLILFWSLVAKGSNGNINLTQIISYFFISMGIRDLVMSHWGPFGSEVGDEIKSGQINNLLVKPVSVIPTLYSISVGKSGMRMLLAIINLIIGIAIFPPKSFISICLFIIFFALALAISFAYNLFQGTLYFHLTDALAFKNGINNFVRILSGELIPLYLFPFTIGQILRFSPFPSMVYGPTIALSTSKIDETVIINILIAIFWAIVLNLLTFNFWKRSIKNYEAIGI